MAPVKLYIYDLSNGMARAMSRQLTGIQIDGVWSVTQNRLLLMLVRADVSISRHTSVVVFGQEVFYGQGISICPPGGSHVGHCCNADPSIIHEEKLTHSYSSVDPLKSMTWVKLR